MTSTSTWDDIPDQVSGGSSDWPLIPEDQYQAEVVEVGEPYEKTDARTGEVVKKFVVKFRLESDEWDEPVEIPSFPKIPASYQKDGYLDSRSTAFRIMKGLGFDMKSPDLKFRPWEWVGMRCRVTTKNETKDGVETSWIDGWLPEKPARTAAPTRNTTSRAPVGAAAAGGRPPLARRLQSEAVDAEGYADSELDAD